MNTFLVIIGILIVGLIIALWAVKKFNVTTKVFGIPLQYVLDIALVIVAIVAVVVIKIALGGKNKTIEALLAKLNIMKSQNNINIVDDHIKEKQDAIATIDQKIKDLQPATQQKDIDNLIAQQAAIKQQMQELNQQKQNHVESQKTLEQKIKDMEAI